MSDDLPEVEDESVRTMAEVLRRHGAAAVRGLPAVEAARAWLAEDFDDAEEVEAWLSARCFDPVGARRLDERGITPEQAALRTRDGASGREDTLGAKLLDGDLTPEEARRIITREFWND